MNQIIYLPESKGVKKGKDMAAVVAEKKDLKRPAEIEDPKTEEISQETKKPRVDDTKDKEDTKDKDKEEEKKDNQSSFSEPDEDDAEDAEDE